MWTYLTLFTSQNFIWLLNLQSCVSDQRWSSTRLTTSETLWDLAWTCRWSMTTRCVAWISSWITDGSKVQHLHHRHLRSPYINTWLKYLETIRFWWPQTRVVCAQETLIDILSDFIMLDFDSVISLDSWYYIIVRNIFPSKPKRNLNKNIKKNEDFLQGLWCVSFKA